MQSLQSETAATAGAGQRTAEDDGDMSIIRKFTMALPALLFLALFLIFWEYAPAIIGIPEYILPPLSRILWIYTDPSTLELYRNNMLVTLQEALVGLVVGSSCGFVIAILLTESRMLMNMMYPYIIALQCMPKVAIAPLLRGGLASA